MKVGGKFAETLSEISQIGLNSPILLLARQT
jgi:hypothetical protein